MQLRRECLNPIVLSPVDFAARLRSGSEEDSFDYAIMDVPELMDGTEHQFLLEPPETVALGTQLAFLATPLNTQISHFTRASFPRSTCPTSQTLFSSTRA